MKLQLLKIFLEIFSKTVSKDMNQSQKITVFPYLLWTKLLFLISKKISISLNSKLCPQGNGTIKIKIIDLYSIHL